MPEPQAGSSFMLVVFVLIGLLNCFAGYRVFRTMLALLGATIGAAIGHALGAAVAPGAVAVVGAILGAVLLAVLAEVGYYASVALLGAFACSSAAVVLVGREMVLVPLLAAAAGGILAIVLQRAIIVFGTAVYGALMAVLGVVLLVGGGTVVQYERAYGEIVTGAAPPGDALGHAAVVALWFGLAVVGIFVQVSRRERERKQTILT